MDDLKPGLAVSPQAAQEICMRIDAARSVSGVSRIHGGEIASIHEITFTDDGPALILKVYPDSLGWKMRKEASVIARVEGRLRVQVPRVLLVDDSKTVLGLRYLVMSKLEGTVLGTLEKALSPASMRAAYIEVGELLRDFHQIPMDGFGYIGEAGIVTRHADNRSYLASQFARKGAEFIERGGGAGLAERIASHVAERENLFGEGVVPRLCHNDLHAGNILADLAVGQVRLTGVLDFEGALAGDPLFDLAKAMFYLDPLQKEAVLTGYGPLGRPAAQDTLALYHLYFTLELWCWFAQIGEAHRLAALQSDLERMLA